MNYVYTRLSCDTERSVSIDDQLKRIHQYAQSQNIIIDRVFVDEGFSGKSMNRPAADEMMSLVKPGDKIVVLKLDRLTRSVSDLAQMVERGIQIASVCEQIDTSSAAGRMMVNMLGVLAQWERETIVERTTDALAAKRERGLVYGPTPFGFTREGHNLVPNPEQQATLTRIHKLRSQKVGYHTIAKVLQAERHPSKSGKPWAAHNVQSIIEAAINQQRAI